MGLQVLELMGISFPDLPTNLDIERRLEETTASLRTKKIDGLMNLPTMTDPNALAAMHILSSITAATFQAVPALCPLILCEQINLSIKHGNAPLSAFAYATYGMLLNGVVQDIEGAYQLGLLAFNLLEQFNAKSLKSKTFTVVAGAIMYGKYHLRETLSLFQEAYFNGIENGDLEWAGYAAMCKCLNSYFSGLELSEVEREMAFYGKVLAQLKQEVNLNHIQIFQQAVLNLLSIVRNPYRLLGDAYDEEKLLSLHKAANDRTGLHYFYIHKLILCYLFEDFTQAIDNATSAEQYLEGVTGQINVSLFYFYDSLVQLCVYPSVSNSEKECLLLKITSNQEKLQRWVKSAPMNFQHKYDLVEAEKSRILGRVVEAMDFYERAIKGAKDNEYIQEEALGYELAAKFYLARGMEKIAQTYMKEATEATIVMGAGEPKPKSPIWKLDIRSY
jgi:tetratricopeptide (TPR) repeat protein